MKTKRHEVTSEVEEDEEIKKECEKYMGMSFCIPFHKKISSENTDSHWTTDQQSEISKSLTWRRRIIILLEFDKAKLLRFF